jgi:hypothetical protein
VVGEERSHRIVSREMLKSWISQLEDSILASSGDRKMILEFQLDNLKELLEGG